MKSRSNVALQKSIALVMAATALLLLIPFTAMQFSEEVAWTASDFVFAGVLLLGSGLLYVVISRKVPNTKTKLIIAGAILFVLSIVWAEFAVGIFN